MIVTIETAQHGVAEFRQKNGITLERLAEKTGVAKSTLIAIEKGNGKPQATTIFKLNQYLSKFE